mgnify:CR=1 FL=1
MGKRTAIEEFTCQNRGGKGVKCYKITEKTGNVIGVKAVNEDNEIMIINTEGIVIRMECAGISILGRVASGVKLINLDSNTKVASIAKVRETVAEENAEETEPEETEDSEEKDQDKANLSDGKSEEEDKENENKKKTPNFTVSVVTDEVQ